MTKDEIKATVSVPEVLERYGVKVIHGRCRGICHEGKNLNAKVSRDFYFCYVCNKGMDIFDLTMHFNQCDFKTALELLGGTDKPSFKAKIKAKQAAKARERRIIERERLNAEIIRFEREIRAYSGLVAEAEPMSDEWCYYVNSLQYQQYRFDYAMEKRWALCD